MKLHKSHLVNTAGKEILLVSLLVVNWSRHHSQAVLRPSRERVWVRPGQPCLMGCPRCSRIYSMAWFKLWHGNKLTGLQDQYWSSMKSSGKEGTLKTLHWYTESYIDEKPHHTPPKGESSPKSTAVAAEASSVMLHSSGSLMLMTLRETLPSSAHRGK